MPGDERTTREMLAERRAGLVQQIAPLQRELDQIDRCLFAMNAAAALSSRSTATIQDGALKILASEPDGLHVLDILARMQRDRPSLKRESLAPQLSRLKRDGKVKSLGRAGWKLVVSDQTTPDAPREGHGEKMMAGKFEKRIEVLSQEQYDGGPFVFDGTLDEVIASLNTIRETIPEPYRATAQCEFGSVSSYDHSHYSQIYVVYTRPSTDDEEAAEDARKIASEAENRRRELAQLAALQAKYAEPTP